MTENPLQGLLHPASIATVGASNNPMKMGTLQALSIVKDGFRGAFYPIHPTEKTVLGHRAFPSVFDLPEIPDLALLVVPTDQVIGLLDAFGRIGTKRAIIISAGFRETGAKGQILERELQAVAHRHGIRFLGPNCMGIVNTQISLNLTVAKLDMKPGPLGFASQSGTYVTQTLPYLHHRGIRFSKAISVGNEANLGIIDALEYLGEDDHTRAIILYIEGIRDGRRFLETARRITPKKPIVAQYVGGTAAGARAGLSHTGAMAGPGSLYEGIFRQAGIIQVRTVEDLYAHGYALATQPPLRGRRVGIVTNSGGPGTAISNNAELGGLDIPRFSTALQSRIRPLISPHAASGNPVDVTFSLDMEVLSRKIPEIIMQSGEVDAIILHGAMSSGFMRAVFPHVQELMPDLSLEAFLAFYEKDLRETVDLPFQQGIPLVVSSFFGREDHYSMSYQDRGVPVLDSPEKAARVMASLLRYREIREREGSRLPDPPFAPAAAGAILREALARNQTALDEYQAKALLAAYGVPVTRESLAQSEEEALAAAQALGGTVVLKACSWETPHKSEKGLVRLHLRQEAQIREAFRDIRKAAASPVAVLVQEMISGQREFIAGMSRFPGFGPCILFGIGGIFSEAFHDVCFRCAPLHPGEAREMTGDIRGRSLLGAFRGMPPVDMEILASLLCSIGYIGLNHPEITEIDLNPLIVAGARPIVVDALIGVKQLDTPAGS